MENEKKVAKDYWFIEDRLYSCDCVSDEPIKTDPCFKVIHCKEVLPSQDKEGWIHHDRFYAMVALNDEKNGQLEQLLEFKEQAIEFAETIALRSHPSLETKELKYHNSLARAFLEKWGEK